MSNFEQMMENEYVVAESLDSGSLACEASSFIGGDPLWGTVKDCYCDN